MKPVPWTFALLLLFAVTALGQPGGNGYQLGDPVDDFTLRNSDGINVSLSDYPDRIIFLVFWYTG